MSVENVNKIVVGFSVDKYKLDYLNGLSLDYLYELASEDVNVIIYDRAEDFFNEMNYNMVDTKNYFWLLI